MTFSTFRRLSLAVVGSCTGALACTDASGQALQEGDYVIGANLWTGGQLFGRVFRLRGQNLTLLFESGANGIDFSQPGEIVIDSQGRVVFASGICDGNPNNSKLLRWDPATGVLSQLICIPHMVSLGGAPPGFPTDATRLRNVTSLHLTRSLRVSIDDDRNGGVPRSGSTEAYGFGMSVYPRRLFAYGQWYDRDHSEAFRYVVDEDRVEPGISTALIPVASGGLEMFANDDGTYYEAGLPQIYRAEPDLTIDVRARTTVSGAEVVVSGRLVLAGQNEQVAGPAPGDYPYIDNTSVPNITLMCSSNGVDVIDSNNPLEPDGGYRPLSDIRSLGVLDGGIFVSTPSPTSAFFFNLGPRAPILNTFYCTFLPCTQGLGPYPASADRPYLSFTSVHNGRILGGDDGQGDATGVGRVFAVTPTSFELLVADPLLSRPRGVAGYPAAAPGLTARTLVVRVDSPLNVLVTDASGRRIGHDADGNPVNDFGASGATLALGPEGHPRVYAVINPAGGDYSVRAVGTGDGPYTIRGYRADTALAQGTRTMITGTAATGAAEDLTLGLGPGLGVTLRRCRADFNASGVLSVQDIFDFLAAYFALDPRADYNASGERGVQDIFDYLAAYFTGCG